jgi:hypothetical protein
MGSGSMGDMGVGLDGLSVRVSSGRPQRSLPRHRLQLALRCCTGPSALSPLPFRLDGLWTIWSTGKRPGVSNVGFAGDCFGVLGDDLVSIGLGPCPDVTALDIACKNTLPGLV